MAVLQATLKALEETQEPGTIVHLPFEWAGSTEDGHPKVAPPIVDYLLKHPFQVTKLIQRKIPEVQ